MISKEAAEAMRVKFGEFCRAWGREDVDYGTFEKSQWLICYYLDVIAAQLMELNKPKQVIMPIKGGRN